VVDDDPGVRETVEFVLRCQGHDVVTAENGRAALDIIRRMDVDLVLTDLRMDEMDGLATLQALRAVKPSTRVLILTGYASEDTRAELAECGAVGILTKPFALGDLYAAVDRAIES
jgi:ATP-dependent Lon protease